MEAETYSGHGAARVVGISYRQLDYWATTGLVRPSAVDASGSGTKRRYLYRDLLELRMVKKLLDAGFTLVRVRQVFAYLREHVDTEISAAHIVIDGNSVLLCDGESLVDVVRNGQGVLNVLALEGLRNEVDSGIVSISGEGAGTARPTNATGGANAHRAV